MTITIQHYHVQQGQHNIVRAQVKRESDMKLARVWHQLLYLQVPQPQQLYDDNKDKELW